VTGSSGELERVEAGELVDDDDADGGEGILNFGSSSRLTEKVFEVECEFLGQ
jgi:hypothetical protein